MCLGKKNILPNIFLSIIQKIVLHYYEFKKTRRKKKIVNSSVKKMQLNTKFYKN
jgi:hypothetical protein